MTARPRLDYDDYARALEANFADIADVASGKLEPRCARSLRLGDFVAYMPEHKYIFRPSRELWPAASVNARVLPVPTGKLDENGDRIFMAASRWLDAHEPVEQLTWAPGEPEIIEHRLVATGGWIEREGARVFNLYRPPALPAGGPALASRWVDHVESVYGPDAPHIIRWLAHRVQRPSEKINHALVLGGAQGIGKDTLLEPVRRAIGPWNMHDISPQQLLGRFNAFAKSVILRVNEARDLGDVDRFGFYDHIKVYCAAPPEVLSVDEKNLRPYMVPNILGVIVTTNHLDALYLPSDDRRHFVAWSGRRKEDFAPAYWSELWRWYDREGYRHIGSYLRTLDLSDFDPKAPPPKTAAFWAVVDANRAPEDAELADVLDSLGVMSGRNGRETGGPDAVTLRQIADRARDMSMGDFANWVSDRRSARQVPHRMEAAGYVPVRNDAAKDGRWKIGEHRQAVYARQELTIRDRFTAAMRLAER